MTSDVVTACNVLSYRVVKECIAGILVCTGYEVKTEVVAEVVLCSAFLVKCSLGEVCSVSVVYFALSKELNSKVKAVCLVPREVVLESLGHLVTAGVSIGVTEVYGELGERNISLDVLAACYVDYAVLLNNGRVCLLYCYGILACRGNLVDKGLCRYCNSEGAKKHCCENKHCNDLLHLCLPLLIKFLFQFCELCFNFNSFDPLCQELLRTSKTQKMKLAFPPKQAPAFCVLCLQIIECFSRIREQRLEIAASVLTFYRKREVAPTVFSR